MPTTPDSRVAVDEIARLFRKHRRDLERAVAAAVRAPRDVVEDACQSAWTIMLRSQPRWATWFAWLRVVAIRQAWEQCARSRTERPGGAFISPYVNEIGAYEYEPPRDRRRGRLRDAALDHQPVQLSAGKARERNPLAAGQLARDRLDLRHLLRGENDAGDPRAPVLEPLDALLAEASSPLGDDLRRRVQPRSDLLGDAVGVERHHRERAQIEERIKDHKLGVSLRRLRLSDLDGNRFWLSCTALALNLLALLNDLMFGPEPPGHLPRRRSQVRAPNAALADNPDHPLHRRSPLPNPATQPR